MARPGRGHRRLRQARSADRAQRDPRPRRRRLFERWGEVLAPCGNRRASVCPA
jgi:hypothetical protein